MSKSNAQPGATVPFAGLVLGLVVAAASPAEGSTVMNAPLTDNAVSGAYALAQYLYSPPMAPSMQKCVAAREALFASTLRDAAREAEGLPTKARQQERMAAIAEVQKAAPLASRAHCMTAALLFLEYANSDVTAPMSSSDSAHQLIVVDELAATAKDLTASAQKDLTYLLESLPPKKVFACGPWFTGNNFRPYVDDPQACDALVSRARQQDFRMDLKYSLFIPAIDERTRILRAGLQACYAGDEVIDALGARSEELWNDSCKAAKLAGLKTDDVQPPDFTRIVAVERQQAAVRSEGPSAEPLKTLSTAKEIDEAYWGCRSWSSLLSDQKGRIVVGFVVGPDGSATNVSIAESTGDPKVDKQAKCIIKKLKFAPPTGDSAATSAEVRRVFTIANDGITT